MKTATPVYPANMPGSSPSIWTRISRYRYIYLLMLPGIVCMLLFSFVPLAGLSLSVMNYNAFKGFASMEWVGLKYFNQLFSSKWFPLMLRNTFVINLLNLILYFPMPILLSVLLNEIRHSGYKRISQTVIYLPHFLSWVVIASLTFMMFSQNVGLINKVLDAMGREPVSVLTNKNAFWITLVCQTIWKESGWGTIIFLAAISNIDTQLYEAAVIDGCTRWQQIRYITLPCISATIVTLLILRLGNIFNTGTEQILLMSNNLLTNVSEVFDTYAYKQGVVSGKFSLGVAVGLFKSIVGLIFIVVADTVSKRAGYEGIY